jgi:hypothetical protein
MDNLLDTIYHIYQSTDNAKVRLDSICNLINNFQSEWIIFYNSTRKLNRKGLRISYDESDLSTINQRIKNEKETIDRNMLIITMLQRIMYSMLTMEGNYYMVLDGQEEMIVLDKQKKYYINLSFEAEQNKIFHAFLIVFALESLYNPHLYLGVDFEYTQKVIALAQLNFEHHPLSSSFIFIVSPNELDKIILKNFIDCIMINIRIKKILHGSDSLDIPYVYSNMLDNNPNKIIKFTKALIDTRFLCEYYKIDHGELTTSKCSIYHALIYFKVISDAKYDELNMIHERMGPPQDLVWNIHRLAKSQVLYALYDVLFLKYFYYQMIKMAYYNQPNVQKMNTIVMYRHVLYETTQFIYLERREITFLLLKAKQEIDIINNYMIRHDNSVMTLITVFNNIFPAVITSDPTVDIDKLISVNYFRLQLTMLFKKIIYTQLSLRFRIYKDKNTIWNGKLSNDYIFALMDKLRFQYLSRVITSFISIINNRINQLRF